MNRFCQRIIFNVRKLKNIPPEAWVQKPQDSSVKFVDADLSHLNIQYSRDIRFKKIQDLKNNVAQIVEEPKPISPVMGPITVQNPKVREKIYRWCSCGQSLKQPFCDGSHEGTSFKPYKFTVQQKSAYIKLCGCKLTTNKPFCDGQSCKCAKKQ